VSQAAVGGGQVGLGLGVEAMQVEKQGTTSSAWL
jgi:hypothetical protein